MARQPDTMPSAMARFIASVVSEKLRDRRGAALVSSGVTIHRTHCGSAATITGSEHESCEVINLAVFGGLL